MKTQSKLFLVSILSLASACGGGGGGGGDDGGASTVLFGNVVAVTDDNRIIMFEPGTPQTVRTSTVIKGLQTGETIVAIDVRPTTGDIVGVSATRMYVIDPATGLATPVGPASFTTPLGAGTVAMHADPVTDDIRVITDNDRNIHMSPESGVEIGQGMPVEYAAGDPAAGSNPRIAAIAFTDDHAFADRTTLFAIDSVQNTLVRIGDVGGTPQPSTSGQIHTIGALNQPSTFRIGFDITPDGGALVSLNAPGSTTSTLYILDLATAQTRSLGEIGVTSTVRALAWRGAPPPRVFGVTDQNELVSFRPGQPDLLLTERPVSGLGAGETIVAIDQRVLDGRTYLLTDASRLYRLDTAPAIATPVGPGVFAPPLAGANFDLEFTPLFGAGRVVGDGDQNLRVNPTTGSVASVDQVLAYGPGDSHFGADPAVVGAAYSNNALGANETTLYAIDSSADTLVRIGSVGGFPDLPNGGMLTTIGALGPVFGARSGLDIDADGVAFAVLDMGGVSQLCKIDLSTGAVRDIGTIDTAGAAGRVIDIAVEMPAPPTLFGVDGTNQLVSFLASAPGQILTARSITGLDVAETMVAVDFDPVTRELIGLSDFSRLFRIHLDTGAATLIGTGGLNPIPPGPRRSIDVDPALGELRVVSDGDGNISVSLVDGTTTDVGQNLAYSAGDPNFGIDPQVASIAHTKSFLGATSPALYAIDSLTDLLVQVGQTGGPASGQLTTVGALTLDVSGNIGFDVDARGLAFVSHGSPSTLYRIDLSTGTLTSVGNIGGVLLRDLAIRPR